MRVANAYRPACAASHDHARKPNRSVHGLNPRSNCCSRNFRNRSGSGILTGHTTPHWLHMVAAWGRSSAFSMPMYDGVRIEPIGPG